MPWNKPGSGNEDKSDSNSSSKDPWTGESKSDNPTIELQTFLKKLQLKKPSPSSKKGLLGLVVVVLITWFLSGFVSVSSTEQALVFSGGSYIKTLSTGFYWIPRIIHKVYVIDTQKLHTQAYRATLLTQDQKIINIDLDVNYRIAQPKSYLFNQRDALQNLNLTIARIVYDTISKNTLKSLLAEDFQAKIQGELKQELNRNSSGLEIQQINIRPLTLPQELQPSFDQVTKARQEGELLKAQANAYARKTVENAKNQVAEILLPAKTYQEQAILNAKSEVVGFLALLPQYEVAPEMIRQQVYLSALENISASSDKVLIGTKSNLPLFYLPLNSSSVPIATKVSTTEAAAEPTAAVSHNYYEGGY